MREEGGYRSQRQREIDEQEGRTFSRPERPEGPERPGGGLCARGGQVWIGAAIIIVGTALLLDNLGVIGSAGQILRFWPVVLIGMGAGDLFAARHSGRATRGTLLTAFGVLFLLNNLDVVNFRIWSLWPLFLIMFGFQMLTSRRKRAGEEDVIIDDPEFDDFAFLGGVKRAHASSRFRGGSATAFMGGVELDLRRASMEGDRAVVNVFAMMGGVSIRVPEDWAVSSQIVAILGGVDDKTRPPTDPKRTLVLTGTAIMGGVEIKD
jgi:predicted membrane protein